MAEIEIYKKGNWFKCSKCIAWEKNMSQSAKWLYVMLSCLNNHFGGGNGVFTRTNNDLMNDCCMSIGTLKRAKKELIDNGYIKCWHNNLYSNSQREKQTTFQICYYKILK